MAREPGPLVRVLPDRSGWDVVGGQAAAAAQVRMLSRLEALRGFTKLFEVLRGEARI